MALLGALFGSVLSLCLFFLIRGAIKAGIYWLVENRALLEKMVSSISFDQEISPLIDQKLAQLTVSFKEKHPMMGLFLTPEIADPLTETAKEKLLEMLPDLKKSLVKKIQEGHFSSILRAVLEKEVTLFFSRTLLYKFLSLGTLVGFLFLFLGSLLGS